MAEEIRLEDKTLGVAAVWHGQVFNRDGYLLSGYSVSVVGGDGYLLRSYPMDHLVHPDEQTIREAMHRVLADYRDREANPPHVMHGLIYDDDDHPTDLSEMGGSGIATEIYGDEHGGE